MKSAPVPDCAIDQQLADTNAPIVRRRLGSFRVVLPSILLGLPLGIAMNRCLDSSVDSQFREALRMVQRRDPIRANEILRRVVVAQPTNHYAWVALAAVAYDLGDFAAAVAAARQIPDATIYAGKARLIEGDGWYSMNRVREAERAWREALRVAPDMSVPRIRLARIFAAQIRREELAAILWEIYDRDEATPVEMCQLTTTSFIHWKPDVVELLAPWATADADDHHTRRALCHYAMDVGRFQPAIDELESMHRDRPDDDATRLALAKAYLRSGRLDAAKTLLADAPRTESLIGRWRQLRGSWALAMGSYDAAVAELESAVATLSFDLPTHEQLARAMRLTGRAHDSERHAIAAQTLMSIREQCLMLEASGFWLERAHALVVLCERMGMNEQALGWARLGAASFPEDTTLQSAVARLNGSSKMSSRRSPKEHQ